MKVVYVMAAALIVSVSAQAAEKKLTCTSQTNPDHQATLTFLNDGSGNLHWNEEWDSASSIAEPNSSEEIGEIYELSDFYSDDAGGFQLIVSHELARSQKHGTVRVDFRAQKQDTYRCR